MDYFNQIVTRNVITSFMSFFSKFSIEKLQTISVSGDDVFAQRKITPVPIQWSCREKWVEIVRSSSSRKQMNPTERDKNPVEMQWILPRISCNITGISYDASRRLIKTQQIKDYQNSSSANATYSPASYNLEVEISTVARHIDDNLQLMEQILPYFAPTMNMNLFLYSDTNSESVPIVLNSVSLDNPTDIPEYDERIFTNVYNFTLKLNYYMMSKLKGVINNIDINMMAGQDVVRINKKWLESQQRIQTTFNQYIANANIPNPLVTYNPTDVIISESVAQMGGEPCITIEFTP